MVNVYCDQLNELNSLFSQLAYFGLIDRDDAQCFLVEAQARTGFFLIAAGSILLALLNTFVSKAAKHYLSDSLTTRILPGTEPKTLMEADRLKDEINPIPVLFTDEFRSVLKRTRIDTLRTAVTSGESVVSDPVE